MGRILCADARHQGHHPGSSHTDWHPGTWKITMKLLDGSSAFLLLSFRLCSNITAMKLNIAPIRRKIAFLKLFLWHNVVHESALTKKWANKPDIWSCDPVSSAQICVWAHSAAPLSSVHGPHRLACHSVLYRSFHLQPTTKQKSWLGVDSKNKLQQVPFSKPLEIPKVPRLPKKNKAVNLLGIFMPLEADKAKSLGFATFISHNPDAEGRPYKTQELINT